MQVTQPADQLFAHYEMLIMQRLQRVSIKEQQTINGIYLLAKEMKEDEIFKNRYLQLLSIIICVICVCFLDGW